MTYAFKQLVQLVQNPFHDMFLHPEASPVADGEGAIFTRVYQVARANRKRNALLSKI